MKKAMDNLSAVVAQQTAYFATQATKPATARLKVLTTMKQRILAYEPRLISAMQADMGKPETEAATAEVWYVLEEIDYAVKNLRRWMKPQKKRTPVLHMVASSAVHPEPLGRVLIISPWNYPFLLLFSPLVGALAAGNVAILKPSEKAPHTAAVIEELINGCFEPGLMRVVTGEADTARALLELPFDHIFFTGGTEVGRLVMKAAAEHLTPVTLELGGKSPVIVDESADLDVAASRITWGKFYNAGQTCIAPDYLLVHRSIHAGLVERLGAKIAEFYGCEPQNSPDLARIITDGHFNRLAGLIDPAKVKYGGRMDAGTRYIAPTVMDNVTLDDRVMEEEIFGPILPVIPYDSIEEVFSIIRQHPNPLALYLFTRDKNVERRVIREIPFGGGCVNDVISHVLHSEIPFGGRGTSGMGSYHGKHTFDTFSHNKSIIRRSTRLDPPLRYPPYRIKQGVMRVIFTIANWLV